MHLGLTAIGSLNMADLPTTRRRGKTRRSYEWIPRLSKGPFENQGGWFLIISRRARARATIHWWVVGFAKGCANSTQRFNMMKSPSIWQSQDRPMSLDVDLEVLLSTTFWKCYFLQLVDSKNDRDRRGHPLPFISGLGFFWEYFAQSP